MRSRAEKVQASSSVIGEGVSALNVLRSDFFKKPLTFERQKWTKVFSTVKIHMPGPGVTSTAVLDFSPKTSNPQLLNKPKALRWYAVVES